MINRGNENFSWASFKVDCDKRLGQAVNHFPILCLAVKSRINGYVFRFSGGYKLVQACDSKKLSYAWTLGSLAVVNLRPLSRRE